MYKRYAVFVTLKGTLGAFGSKWLGWDSVAGATAVHPDLSGIDVARITETPRKYGLHGTIKPPFFLADGTTAEDLKTAMRLMCARLRVVRCDGLALSQMGPFLALTAVGDTCALSTMAAKVVETLDPFRAPPSAAELARRTSRKLTPEQAQNLERWGYPYVMDAFRFHITLSGPLGRQEASNVHRALEPIVAPLLPSPFVVDHLTLCGQDDAGMFHQLTHYALTG